MPTLQRRQFDDVFNKIATASTTASAGAITTGSQAAVAVTVPGVAVDGTWDCLAVTYNQVQGAVSLTGQITAANTVTIYIQNNSGGTITPTASTLYTVVVGQIDAKYKSL